jgi:hypothetical protein
MQGMPKKGVAFLHENAHLQIALHTIDTLGQLHFEVLEHPPFCSHLAFVDYHVFGPLQDALQGLLFYRCINK